MYSFTWDYPASLESSGLTGERFHRAPSPQPAGNHLITIMEAQYANRSSNPDPENPLSITRRSLSLCQQFGPLILFHLFYRLISQV